MLWRVPLKKCVYFLLLVIVVRYFFITTSSTRKNRSNFFGKLTKKMEILPEFDCFAIHGFNECLSDQIAVDRRIPDLRSNHCKNIKYNRSWNVPKTSIIMTFHNEAWSTLLRSVHSILNRSPEYLVEEIILIDDFSNMGE